MCASLVGTLILVLFVALDLALSFLRRVGTNRPEPPEILSFSPHNFHLALPCVLFFFLTAQHGAVVNRAHTRVRIAKRFARLESTRL